MVNNSPFFTVVIPSYNRAELIKEAIKSVLRQTFKNWELIVADDCSTDNTEEVVKDLNIENLRFFKNNVNKGNAGARNLGSRQARGKYISFLDSDDQFHEDFLEKMHVIILDSKFPGFLWSNVNWIDTAGNVLDHSIPDSWEPLKQKDPYVFFLKGLKFGTGYGFTVRRDCFEKTGYFDENLRTAVDTDFILRIVQDFNFNFSNNILVDTYDHGGERVRKDSIEKLKAYKIIFEKHKNTINKYKSLTQSWNYKLMWLSYHNNKKDLARKYLSKAIKAEYYKAVLIALLFELFNKSIAMKLHKKLSD